MENYAVFLWSFLIGLVYFGLVTFLVRRFHFKYLYGMILPLTIVFFCFVMMVYTGQVSTNAWEGLGYLILTLLGLCILIGYLSGWVFVALVQKAKK
jgi:hypothetical protein